MIENDDAEYSALNANQTPAVDLTTFQQNLLFALLENPKTKGLEVKRRLEAVYDKEVNHGRLYPNLDTLVEMGLVRKEERDRRTNEYTVTKRGLYTLKADVRFKAKAMGIDLHESDFPNSPL